MIRYLYFNINYICNSRCVFCASNYTRLRSREVISYRQFRRLLDRYAAKNSQVVINGGEPLLHKDILRILKHVKKRGMHCILFTNGRKLSDPAFAEEVLNVFSGQIQVPLYGATAKRHDPLTGIKGSFSETIAGINNIVRFKKSQGKKDVKLLLKLLYIKPLLRENVDIAKYIISRIPEVDNITLNGLLFSNAVQFNRKLIASIPEIRESVNKTIDCLKRMVRRKKIALIDLPDWIIYKRNKMFKPAKKLEVETAYFDPFNTKKRPKILGPVNNFGSEMRYLESYYNK